MTGGCRLTLLVDEADRDATLPAVQWEKGFPTPDRATGQYFDRPYQTVLEDVPQFLMAGVTGLPTLAGSIEQWVDNLELLSRPRRRQALQATYRAWMKHD